MTPNVGQQFDRLPSTPAERTVDGRAARTDVTAWWEARYGVPPSTFDGYSFWEKGAGKIWVFHGEVRSPIRVEALGMRLLHTRQEHWKPTTDAVQRFGAAATRNVLHLPTEAAAAFVEGEDQRIDWDGDWGYLIVTRTVAGEPEPIGVGLYTYGELKSQIPKGRRSNLPS